ncbi:MAG: MFS transporter [Candidatus Kapabacteria bacterium]|nr:MFS transporter [Candidatus Kapabacteria bacterium]
MRSQRLQRNIYLLRLLRIANMALFTIPVLVVYYRHLGLSMQDVMSLQAIFAVTMVVIEVPSGYFSDVLGRRTTMIIGTFLALAGWSLYVFAVSFTEFLIAETFLGVGMAFMSGTDSAMLYDTLLEMGHAENSLKEEGAQLSYANFSEAGAAIVGGALAAVSLHLPFYVQAVWMIIPIGAAFMLVEPSMHRRVGHQAGIVEMKSILAQVFQHDKLIRALIVTSSILSASTLVMVWLLQPYWTYVGIPVALFGILWASGNALVGVVSIRAHTIATRVSTRMMLTVLVAAVGVSSIVAGLWPSMIAAGLLAIMYISRGLLNPVINNELNRRVSSGQRATVLSIRQLGMRFVFLIAAPFIGYMGDITSIPTSVLISGALFTTLGGVSLLLWPRNTEVPRSG